MLMDAGPRSPHEIGIAVSEAEADLTLLYSDVDFLTRYPLRHVVSSRYLVRQRSALYTFKDLMGDHPLVLMQEREYFGDHQLQQGALYFSTPSESLYLVHPWMAGFPCPRCGFVETYVFDRLDERSHRVVIKSLERGHDIETESIRDDLVTVGLLSG